MNRRSLITSALAAVGVGFASPALLQLAPTTSPIPIDYTLSEYCCGFEISWKCIGPVPASPRWPTQKQMFRALNADLVADGRRVLHDWRDEDCEGQ